MNRRLFLSAGLVGLTAKADRAIAGTFVNESQIAGHRLRDRVPIGPPKRTEKVGIVIVGGGMAGLSAAWRLEKKGYRDFVVLEIEPQAGGNSRFGENDVSAYPWAAHYVPVPNKEAVYVQELMQELGVLKDGKYDERYLCFSPQERLFLHGRFQEGLEPETAATQKDRQEFQRFDELMKEHRASGRFTIPFDAGARPSPLDQISMHQWLKQNKFESPYLHWYADYSCRDDYGAKSFDTSAFAGIHYFASREHDEKGPLTWPEGNGWILRRLTAKLQRHIRTNSPVYRVEKNRVLTPDVEYKADRVIFAAPTFLSRYLMDDPPPLKIEYSPWLTANLTLDRLPNEKGIELAWDNVIFDSPTLGYVNATHMSLKSHIDRTVWTFYWALAAGTPADNRRLLLAKDWNYWKEAILNDLQRAHPDIRQCVSRIDIMRIGHAMARPTPGSLFHPDRKKLIEKGHNGILYANSDLSGFSIFEEAQYRGVRAADAALKSSL